MLSPPPPRFSWAVLWSSLGIPRRGQRIRTSGLAYGALGAPKHQHDKSASSDLRDLTAGRRLFDHIVGAGKDRLRDCEPERLGRIDVDNELHLYDLLDRQIGRTGSVEDLAGVNAD